MWRWAVVLGLIQVVAVGQQKVPFVGCPGSGQLGPIEAPTGKPVTLKLPSQVARQLALYTGGPLAVLAPRGWSCIANIGSNGHTLIVSNSKLEGFPQGPLEDVISVTYTWGGGAGHQEVAEIIARVFRDHMSFAENVAEMFPFEVPSGPFPSDVLTSRSPLMVEFRTPANTDGLAHTGQHWIGYSSTVEGVAILRPYEWPDTLVLTVKLPERLRSLAPHIIQHFERTEKELGPR